MPLWSHAEWQHHYSYPGIKLIGRARPSCGGVSNAGSWPPVSSATEANGTCQFHDKYQIVCLRVLETEPSEVAIRLMNC